MQAILYNLPNILLIFDSPGQNLEYFCSKKIEIEKLLNDLTYYEVWINQLFKQYMQKVVKNLETRKNYHKLFADNNLRNLIYFISASQIKLSLTCAWLGDIVW